MFTFFHVYCAKKNAMHNKQNQQFIIISLSSTGACVCACACVSLPKIAEAAVRGAQLV